MLFVLSPAKSLDFESDSLTSEYSEPLFLDQAEALVERMKEFSAPEISKLMGVSDKIAELNVDRYEHWSRPFKTTNAKQAIYAFKGDVYTGIAIETAEQKQIDYLDKHVRILSGLYGALRPLDLMQAYRLEMGTRLENAQGKNLYEFWGMAVTDYINSELQKEDDGVLVNLASNEYFKVLKPKKIEGRIVTPVFKDKKAGQYKIVSFYAKKARGLMVRYAADQCIRKVDDLKGFDYAGYRFNAELSGDDEWVYTRDEAPGK